MQGCTSNTGTANAAAAAPAAAPATAAYYLPPTACHLPLPLLLPLQFMFILAGGASKLTTISALRRLDAKLTVTAGMMAQVKPCCLVRVFLAS